MSKKIKFNWPIISLLLVLGAVPALPATYFMAVILKGPPVDGSEHALIRAVYFTTPAPILLHGFAGIIFANLMPFQFSPRLRATAPRWHRWSGRLVILSAYLIAISALWMILVFPPTGGVLKTAGLLATAGAMITAFTISLRAILRRNIRHHRAWMMRAIAVTYGALPPVLVYLGWFLVAGEPPQLVADLDRWYGMAINLAIVEWVLRRRQIISARVVPTMVEA